jgi:hypothetical protein
MSVPENIKRPVHMAGAAIGGESTVGLTPRRRLAGRGALTALEHRRMRRWRPASPEPAMVDGERLSQPDLPL